MSIKRIITKLALAFAAKKGVEVFQSMGGVSGLKSTLAGKDDQPSRRGGMLGRIGGASDAQTGGLGNILESLGAAGATYAREAGMTGQINRLNQSFGGLLGSLASVLGNRSAPDKAAEELEEELHLEDIEDDQDSRPILRAMVQMARADGEIDRNEEETLVEIMDDASASEKAILRDALREPIDAKAIAAETPDYARKEVYSAALLVGQPDNEREHAYLRSLASALDLSSEDVARLHSAMGKSQLGA